MQSESNRIEYKEALNDKLERSIISFLNYHAGGRLYIGMNDEGEPVPNSDIDGTQKKIIDRVKNNILPNTLGLFDVIVEEVDGVEVICVIISSGSEKPYYIKDYGMSPKGCAIRVGNTTQQMTLQMIDKLFQGRNKRTIVTIPANIQDLTFRQLKIYYEGKKLDIGNNFEKNFEFFTPDGRYNMLAYLFADENSFSFRFAKYAGTDKSEIIENEEYGYCSLVKAMDKVLERFDVENKTFAKVTYPKRLEKNLVDKNSLREFVINAFAHNDYADGDTPIFEMFSDRISITSYGGLVDGLTEKDFFECCTKTRNREIMRIFKDLNFVEQLGSGTRKTFKVYDKSIFKFTPNFLFVNFPFEKGFIPENSGINSGINQEKEFIVNLMRENPKILTDELIEKTGLNAGQIEYRISVLKKESKIKRKGSKKNGEWIITN
ncbi:MAG: putative DNA binding domain-containing protein [Clostridiales bacterium]|jgi:predicted HTH transcriptional regulator|nr:putative DNA binding domain-containing protein [Clostridiales bacterium]